MNKTFVSPNGDYEVWDTKPDGYMTVEEWLYLHPTEVTAKQIRLALLHMTLLRDVEKIIASGSTDEIKQEAEIEWEYGTTIHKSGKFMTLFREFYGFSDDQIDDIFVQASRL